MENNCSKSINVLNENKPKLNYSNKEYWENRFENQKGYFDWYGGWNEIKDSILTNLNNDNKEKLNILIVGCGNSQITENLYKEGFCNITNIDIASNVIENMRIEFNNKYKTFNNNNNDNNVNINYLQMDATSMNFKDNTFDLIIEKGTLDALSCAESNYLCKKLLKEMLRVCSINGNIALYSHSSPTEKINLILDSLGHGSYELLSYKIKLSSISNIINSIRSNKQGKNLSFQEALKDKTILINSLIEVLESKKEDLDNIKNNNENSDKSNKIRKLSKYLKIMKLIDKKKNNNLINEINESKKEELLTNNGKKTNNITNKNSVNTSENNSFNTRRNYFYFYNFKKIK